MRLLITISTLALLPGTMLCQTMVESAILSGSVAASASGSAATTGNALSKALGNADASLSTAAGRAAASPARTARVRAKPPLPKPLQAVFEGVEPGMSRADLIARAGKPQFGIASSDEEVLRYTTREGGSIRIRVAEGKVTSVEQTPPKTAPTPPPTLPADPGK